MTDFSERFRANNMGLQAMDALQYSAADKSVVRLDNLDWVSAIKIAHELTIKLDAEAATGRHYNPTNYRLAGSLENAHTKMTGGEEVIFRSEPGLGNLAVEVRRPGDDYELEIGRTLKDNSFSLISRTVEEERIKGGYPEAVKQALQRGYIALMDRVEFFPVSPEQEDIEKRLIQLDVRVPRERIGRIGQEVKEVREKDILGATTTLRMLGVREVDLGQIADLWESRNLSRVALIDLWLHVVSEKQSLSGEKFPAIYLKDLVQTGVKQPAVDLRGDQAEQSQKIFVKSFGFDAEEVKNRFEIGRDDERRALSLRLTAWLATQPFMAEFRDEIRQGVSAGRTPTSLKLFQIATKHIYGQYREHLGEQSRYDQDIDWKADEFSRKKDLLRTSLMLCMNVFFDQDVSQFVQGDEPPARPNPE